MKLSTLLIIILFLEASVAQLKPARDEPSDLDLGAANTEESLQPVEKEVLLPSVEEERYSQDYEAFRENANIGEVFTTERMLYYPVRSEMDCFGVPRAYIQGNIFLVEKRGRVEFDLVCPEAVQALDLCPRVSALRSRSSLIRYVVQFTCIVEEAYKPSSGFQLQVSFDSLIDTDLTFFELSRNGGEVTALSRQEVERRMLWANHRGYYARNPNAAQFQKVTLKQFDVLNSKKC